MQEVSVRGEDYIIERAGKPLVAVIPIEKYRQIQEAKKEFFKWVNEARGRTKDIKSEVIEEAISKAVKEVRQAESKTRKNSSKRPAYKNVESRS